MRIPLRSMRPIPGGVRASPEPFGTLLIAIVILIALGMYFAFLLCYRLATNLKIKRLIKQRPWLLGPVHGTFSAAFTTIWHRDVGIQLVSHDLIGHLSFNSYVVRAKGNPFAIVPTSCFYQSDWHEILDTIEQRQQGFLLPIPPVIGSHVCALRCRRLSFLETRLRGFRWKSSVGGISWYFAAVTAFALWQNVGGTIPIGLILAVIPALVFVFYLFRVALWTWHTKRQFANEKRGYFSVPEFKPGRAVSWFNRDVIFWNTGRMWIHIPPRYVEKVLVEFSVIEFQARGLDMQFHREGFQHHSEWLAACETAKAFP